MPDILANAERLAAGIAGARKVVLADVAHLPPLEHPAEFNRLVLDFLRERRGAARATPAPESA